MKLRTSLVAATLLAVPAAAFAMGPGSSGQSANAHAKMPKSPVPKFKKADKNGNGKISWKEAKAVNVPKKLFKRDDFNHNGKLNKTEWMFVRLDMTNNKKKPSAGKGG